jgi:hypothetical protein
LLKLSLSVFYVYVSALKPPHNRSRVHPEIHASTPPDFLRADPRTRRIALVAVGVIVVMGATAIEWLLPRLSALASAGHISRKSICIGFLIFVIVLVAPVAVAGVENWRLGREAVKSRQFPSQRTRVLVDIRIKRGAPAVTLGKVQRLLGAFLIIAGLLLLCVAGFGVYKLW